MTYNIFVGINMKKLLSLLLLVLALGASTPAYADYGAAQPTTTLLVNKTIFNPQTNQFVENITVDKQAFLPGQESCQAAASSTTTTVRRPARLPPK